MVSPLLGREAVLAELNGLLDAARCGAGALVLLTGEAGIGKSTVVDRLTAAARDADVPVAVGRAVADDGAPAYWPWHRALDGGVPGLSAAVLDTDPAAQPEPGPASVARFRIADRVVRSLLAAAEPAGLLVVLEDVQWADDASLGVLRQLCGELTGARVLVVATVRDPDAGRTAPAPLTELATAGTVRTIVLPALTAEQTGRYVALLAGAAVDGSWTGYLHRLTDGNPLFLRELVRLLSADGQLAGPVVEPGLPVELRRVLGRRLALLSAACRRLLAAASAIGADVDVAVLAAAGADRWPTGPEHLLAEATAAGVLVDEPESPGRVRFSHELLRRACYDELPRADRVDWHRRIADAWAARYGDERPGELARHRVRAAVQPAQRWAAAQACRSAGDAAAGQFAFAEAIRWYDEAAGLLDGSPDAPLRRAELHLAAAEAAYRDGQVTAALARCGQVSALGQRLGSAELTSRAALTVRGVGGSADEPIAALCTAARALLGDEDSARHAQVLAQHAFVLADAGQLAAARPLGERAMAMAERCSVPDALVGALHAWHEVNLGPDGVTERLAAGTRMARLAEASDRPDAALWAHVWRIDAVLEVGAIDAFDAEVFELAGLADRLGWPMVRWHLLRARSARAMLQGDHRQAQEHALAARDVAATMQDGIAHRLFYAMLVPIMIRTGQYAPHWDSVLAVTDLARGAPVAAAQFGMLFAAAGQPDRAAAMLDTLRPVLPDLAVNSQWLAVMTIGGELAARLGDRQTAAGCYDRMLPYAGHYLNTTTGWYGCVARVCGVVAAALGDLAAADRHLGAAVQLEHRIGSYADAAVARLDHARALAARGSADDRARAVELAGAARRAADRFGLAPTAAGAAELLERLSGTGPAGPLTTREHQVALLVAEGLSNRVIAQRLFLSERTVETHVRHVLTKLDLANRTQVAGWALRAGRS